MKMAKRVLGMILVTALLVVPFMSSAAPSVTTVGSGTVSYEAGVLTNYGAERTDAMLIGGRYTIGAYDVTLTSLGYYFCSGNGNVTINVYDTATSELVATAITDSTKGVADQVLYADLATPITLSAGKSYYVLAVTSGSWKETVGVAANSDLVTCTGRCFFDGANFVVPEELIYNYVGVTMKYQMTYNPYVADVQEMVTASEICTANGSGIWNDFGSYIGMTIIVGDKDMAVTSIGRMAFAGNNQIHNLRIVDAQTKTVLATVPVDMTKGTTGSYLYADLPYVVNLKAGKTYYVLSEEHMGGDMSGQGDYYNSAISDALAKDGSGNIMLYGCYYVPNTYTEVPQTGYSRSYVGLNLKYGEASDAPTPDTEPTTTTTTIKEGTTNKETTIKTSGTTKSSPTTGETGFASVAFAAACVACVVILANKKIRN